MLKRLIDIVPPTLCNTHVHYTDMHIKIVGLVMMKVSIPTGSYGSRSVKILFPSSNM